MSAVKWRIWQLNIVVLPPFRVSLINFFKQATLEKSLPDDEYVEYHEIATMFEPVLSNIRFENLPIFAWSFFFLSYFTSMCNPFGYDRPLSVFYKHMPSLATAP